MAEKTKILPADPRRNYLAHRDEIDEAVRRVLDGGWYILGPEVAAFEAFFAGFTGCAHGIGVANGTDALHLALRACGIGPGHAVFTVSHTAVATVAAIDLAGATPVLVDVDPHTYTLDPGALRDVLEACRRQPDLSGGAVPAAVIPVHLYGHPCDMSALRQVADEYGLVIIEDCAQAHGAGYGGCRTGMLGKAAAFSFYPTKNLGALGDGGAVVTNDDEVAAKLRLLREYGWQSRYVSEIAGMNSRLDEVQAAILHVKLFYLEQENARRRAIAQLYDQYLADLPAVCPAVKGSVYHVFHQYVIRINQRDAVRQFLQGEGIGTLIHYPVPVHCQPAYAKRGLTAGRALPVTEKLCTEILSLPMHPQLTDDEVAQVGAALRRWYRSGAA
jgi:dTDP-4-amino-4,6-dideoxygalactose transaminase